MEVYGGYRYTSTHSEPRYYLEVCVKIYASPALLVGKGPIPRYRRLSEPQNRYVRFDIRERSHFRAGNRNSIIR